MNRKLSLLQRRLGMRSRGAYTPKISFLFGLAGRADDDYFLRLPFKRSIPIILLSAGFLAAFSIPLFTLGEMFAGDSDGSLSSLVSVLFSLFWALGWSSGVAVLLLLFLAVSVGRETLSIAESKLTIGIGIPGIALGVSYSGELIRNLRYEGVATSAGRKWRGSHIVFDYEGVEIGFGSNISSDDARRTISRIEALFSDHSAQALAIAKLAHDEGMVSEDKLDSLDQSEDEANHKQGPLRWNSLSVILLLLANLIPLLGVLLANWNIAEIMLLFWAESAIIGFYNLCKMWQVGRWSLLFYGPFFVGHYGAFMAVHLLFIYALFSGDIANEGQVSQSQVLNDVRDLWPALLGLFISHGVSYYVNFAKTRKFRGRTMALQMQEPYRRVVIMHLTLIIGGFLSLSLGTGIAALVLLLVLKIVADLRSHLAQHSK